jgi:hypothetical protein
MFVDIFAFVDSRHLWLGIICERKLYKKKIIYMCKKKTEFGTPEVLDSGECSMGLLYVGLAYSNVQNKYDAPSFVTGVRISERNLRVLTQEGLESKDGIIIHRDSLKELREAFGEAEVHLDDYVTVARQSVKGQVEIISEAYLEAVNYLLGDNFRLFNEELIISYNKIMGIPGFGYREVSSTIKEKLQKLAGAIEGKEDSSTDYPMQIARLLARLEYEQVRFRSPPFLTNAILRNPNRYFQFHKMSYHRMPLEDFADDFVSFPEFLVRKAGGSATRLAVKPQCTLVDFQPIAKFCRGIRENGWMKPCEGSAPEQPYGRLVYGSQYEKCDVCRKKENYADCLKSEPSCDGIEVRCGNKYFAGEICNGEFGLYITRYGDSLKVGKAFFPNLISRLLDQGANSALLLYPVTNIKRAYRLENALKDFLEHNIEKIGLGIENVTLSSPPFKEKVIEFLEHWDRSDDDLLSGLAKLVDNAELELENERIDLSTMKKKIANFLVNYKAPSTKVDVKPVSLMAERIKGRIVGYRGSIIFLDSKLAFDMKKLQGYVLRGRIRCLAC